jgi:hypothetical protein
MGRLGLIIGCYIVTVLFDDSSISIVDILAGPLDSTKTDFEGCGFWLLGPLIGWYPVIRRGGGLLINKWI